MRFLFGFLVSLAEKYSGTFAIGPKASIHRTKFGLSSLHGGGKNFCDGFHRGTHLPLPNVVAPLFVVQLTFSGNTSVVIVPML
jgi:hypothetical protein